MKFARDTVSAFGIPLAIVSMWCVAFFLKADEHPAARLSVYSVGIMFLAFGMIGLVRRARDHRKRTGEDPPLFLISLFWQKVAIALVLVCFMVSSGAKSFGYPTDLVERFTLAGHLASATVFGIVSLLLFLDSKKGLLYKPTKPGILGLFLGEKPGRPQKDTKDITK